MDSGFASSASSQDVTIRNCVTSDLRRIEEIEESSFDDPYPLSLFKRLLKESPGGFRVALLQDKIVGYCVLIKVDECSLLIASIAIDSQYKRRGIGTRLVEDAISIGRTHHASKAWRIQLQVREDNFSAISLYTKSGFRKESVIQNYYGVGTHALVMTIDI